MPALHILLYRFYRHHTKLTGADVIFILLLFAAEYVYAWGRICQKSGRRWTHLLVPFYGWHMTFRIAGCPNSFFLALGGLLALLPGQIVLTIAGIAALLAAHCIQCVHLGRAFDCDKSFVLGLIFLNPVFIIKLGTGGTEYILDNPRARAAWTCKCGTINPYGRERCENCGARNAAPSDVLLPPDDSFEGWACECSNFVPLARAFCPRCGGAKTLVFSRSVYRWTCPCGKEHPASHFVCTDCGAQKPHVQPGLPSTKPSVWRCACRRTNSFAHAVCPGCGRTRPEDLSEILHAGEDDSLR